MTENKDSRPGQKVGLLGLVALVAAVAFYIFAWPRIQDAIGFGNGVSCEAKAGHAVCVVVTRNSTSSSRWRACWEMDVSCANKKTFHARPCKILNESFRLTVTFKGEELEKQGCDTVSAVVAKNSKFEPINL